MTRTSIAERIGQLERGNVRMALRSRILVAFVGVLVAAGVWCWPEGPLWQVEKGTGIISGFSPDGRVLVTSSHWPQSTNQVTRWEARTGRLLTRAEMTCDPRVGDDMRCVLPSPDG